MLPLCHYLEVDTRFIINYVFKFKYIYFVLTHNVIQYKNNYVVLKLKIKMYTDYIYDVK